MPGDLVAHDHTVTAEADLDPVLRDVRDRPPSLDRISADRNRGIRPVRDDPAFLIEETALPEIAPVALAPSQNAR